MKAGTRGRTAAAWLLWALLLGCIGYLLFAHLGDEFIHDYDEARHGVNAYEMVRSGDYLVHTYQGEPDLWNLKPPLSFWAIALAYRIFGYNAFALRFFSALSILASVAGLSLWVWRRWGMRPALLLLLLFAANSKLYGDHFARFGDADALYQLFFTLAMLCMLHKRFEGLYGSALCFGLAFLTKGSHALMIPAVCLAYVLLSGRIRELTWKRLGLLVLAGLALIVPWAVARYLRDGTVFFEGMIGMDVVDRLGGVANPADAGMNPFWYYFKAIFVYPAQWISLALCALALGRILLSRTPVGKEDRRRILGAALWAFLPMVLYAVTGAKFKWYVYSSFLAMPVLTVALLHAAPPDARAVRLSCLTALSAALCVFTVQNMQTISRVAFDHSGQEFLQECLDRDFDAGTHAYIQYSEADASGDNRTEWMQGEMLTALLCGDVECLDGGAEAFEADEDSAVLILYKRGNEDDIERLGWEHPLRLENGWFAAYDS